ncbi:MAG: cell division protein ZapA [Nitrospirota bacterium]
MNKEIQVEIYGQQYMIKGDAEDKYVSGLAKYVDQKMREIASLSKDITISKAAILAALNIVHELFQERVEQQKNQSIIKKKTEDIIDNIEEHFEDLKFF